MALIDRKNCRTLRQYAILKSRTPDRSIVGENDVNLLLNNHFCACLCVHRGKHL
jgi:hypothetical protein